MSFTSEVKKQLSELEIKSKSAKKAEFYALYIMSEGRFRSASGVVAKNAEKLCLRSGGVVERSFYRSGAKPVYGSDLRWSGSFSLSDRTVAASFLRGCFIASGYVSDPDSPSHMEITFRNVTAYELGLAAFELVNLFPKGTIKGKRYVLYFKDSDQISAFLVTVGAIRAVLEYENVRITREGRRNSNRVLNCDDANINKALNAGARQVKIIESVMDSEEYLALPDGVREIASLRLKNPELSLTELGELCSPKVSKAGAAHRFSKIEKLYNSKSRHV